MAGVITTHLSKGVSPDGEEQAWSPVGIGLNLT